MGHRQTAIKSSRDWLKSEKKNRELWISGAEDTGMLIECMANFPVPPEVVQILHQIRKTPTKRELILELENIPLTGFRRVRILQLANLA